MDYSTLDWGWGGGLAPRANADWTGFSGQATNILAADEQNARLLASLGYGGDPLLRGTHPEFGWATSEWSPEALAWLAGQGYQAGVGHVPGSKAGGRAEYWGLLDPDGKYVQGQSAPGYSVSSDKPWLEFASMALPIVAMGTSMALSGAGAAGSGLSAAKGIGTLGAGGTDVAALGSAWSPQSLGLTSQAVQGGLTATELSALSAALPALGAAGLSGGAAGGLGALGAAGAGAGAGAAVTSTLPSVLVTGSAAASTAPAWLAPTLAGGAAAGAAAGAGGGGASAQPNNSYRPSQNYGEGMSGAQTGAYDTALNLTGSKPIADFIANSGIGSSLTNGIDTISKLVGGGSNLAGLIGGIAGAVEGGKPNTATSQSKTDPRLDQYLYGTGYGDPNSILGAAQKLWQDNRSGINPTMQQGLDMQRSALLDPAYAQSFQQMRGLGNELMSQPIARNPFTQGGGAPSSTAQPPYQPREGDGELLDFSVMNPAFDPFFAPQIQKSQPLLMPTGSQAGGGGLLGGPTAKAGGPGGLLGSLPADRLKALMAGGRGLIG